MRPIVRTSTTRNNRPALALGTAVLVAVALSGCAGEDEPRTVPAAPGAGSDAPVTSSPESPSPSPSTEASSTETSSTDTSSTASPTTATGLDPAVPLAADLAVSVDDGSGAPSTWTLTCEPVSGEAPDPEQACTELGTVGPSVFAPPPKDLMCTEVFGGPEVATVTGTFAGEPVNATFSRTDGCEIARWDSVSSLLGPVGEAGR